MNAPNLDAKISELMTVCRRPLTAAEITLLLPTFTQTEISTVLINDSASEKPTFYALAFPSRSYYLTARREFLSFANDPLIYQNEYFRIEQDFEIPIPGFLVLLPQRQLRSVADFTESEAASFIKLLCSVRKGMKNVLNIKTVYLFENEDTKHNFHLWVFPRYDWMQDFGQGIQSVKPIMLFAQQTKLSEETVQQIKEQQMLLKQYLSAE